MASTHQMNSEEMIRLAARACERARQAGAGDARAVVARGRVSQLEYRDRKVDTLKESTEKGLDLTVYIDGKYSTNSTNDLREAAVDTFIRESVAMTRYLGQDPHRHLPDPERYAGRREVDLELYDDSCDAVQADSRHAMAREIESAALERGGDGIISVSAYCGDVSYESAMVASNGFQGSTRRTYFWCGAEATASDEGDRRPEGSWAESCRHRADLEQPATIGRRAVERALQRVGAERIPTAELPVIVENRAALRLARYLREAFDGRALQQRMSYLDGKQGEVIMAPALSVVDDPFVKRGQGSRLYDDEGMSSRRIPLVERGRLRNFYIDTYYAGKLGVEPATRRTSCSSGTVTFHRARSRPGCASSGGASW
jgi:PmbA protein